MGDVANYLYYADISQILSYLSINFLPFSEHLPAVTGWMRSISAMLFDSLDRRDFICFFENLSILV